MISIRCQLEIKIPFHPSLSPILSKFQLSFFLSSFLFREKNRFRLTRVIRFVNYQRSMYENDACTDHSIKCKCNFQLLITEFEIDKIMISWIFRNFAIDIYFPNSKTIRFQLFLLDSIVLIIFNISKFDGFMN